ncbi:MAG: hypothetical protein D3906_10035 [Candidatus Electrothrix sp. AUS1_2]|nr:hypothetical protein [Candidatus Electrothrix sp. AUS1_2]
MNKNNLKFLLAIVFASSSAGAADSFAASGSLSLAVPDVSALTVKEAHAKYGVDSEYEYPFVFEVNAKLGSKKCVQIGPDCSFACPTPKIYSQSSHHYLNPDGSRTVRVDVYYDINQAVISREPSC